MNTAQPIYDVDIDSNLRIAYDQVGILGIPINDLSLDDTIAAIDGLIDEGGFHQIATANLDFLTKAIKDEELREVLCRCDLVVADGMPLVWASQMMGFPLRQRVTGADLLPRLAELSQRKQRKIFLLGGTEERSRAGVNALEAMYPGCQIVGRYSPPLGTLDELDHAYILEMIERAAPDVLLVAFGNPKQEKWLSMHRHRLNVPVCIGIGASLDFLSGDLSRAPMWMQQSGLEWFFRFVVEPRRLAARYLSNLACVLRHLSVQVITVVMQDRNPDGARISFQRRENALIAKITGYFSGPLLEEFATNLQRGLETNDCLVLDLSLTTALGADALGLLAKLGSQMAERRQDVWLTGMQSGMRRVLKRSLQLERPFRIAPQVNDVLRRVNCMIPNVKPRKILHEVFSYQVTLDSRPSTYAAKTAVIR
jgi:N-acetylglucosaminyldiphosphoundecaprenol N-acetyl-beta-D-mannosaminyltransferase